MAASFFTSGEFSEVYECRNLGDVYLLVFSFLMKKYKEEINFTR